MSDNEDYSDSENSNSSVEKPISKKKISEPTNINFTTYENDDDSDVEEEGSESDEESEALESDLESQAGGADSDLEEGEIYEGDESEKEEEEKEEGEEEENEGQDEKKTSVKQIKSKKRIPVVLSEDDDDDEYDENYLQKFDSEISKNYIIDYHPECLNHNYEEISKLTIVVRNNDNIIVDPLHRTIPFLTKYEKARILGQRAKQIETGAKPLVKLPENVIDSYIIAELELREKKIPFIIKRPIPSGGFEYWHLKDLEMIGF